MKPKAMNNTGKEKIKKNKSQNKFMGVKSNFVLKKIFNYLDKDRTLKIIRYNTNIKNRLNINIDDYKTILIEIIPVPNKYEQFINISEYNKKYIHIYFNDNKEEINRTKLIEGDEVSKINVVIDYQVKSFRELFTSCISIGSINFKRFYRNNITNMSDMFSYCTNIKEINFSNFNTNNVTDMSNMFFLCSSLKELNLAKFNTSNVTNMKYMFSECHSLQKINISSFSTGIVKNMKNMFYRCEKLIELNLSNFNTRNVIDMSGMFYECYCLKELNISNFNTRYVTKMNYMLSKCSSLKKLNLNHFNINSTTNMINMLAYFKRELKWKALDKELKKIVF